MAVFNAPFISADILVISSFNSSSALLIGCTAAAGAAAGAAAAGAGVVAVLVLLDDLPLFAMYINSKRALFFRCPCTVCWFL